VGLLISGWGLNMRLFVGRVISTVETPYGAQALRPDEEICQSCLRSFKAPLSWIVGGSVSGI
jgi:hypothetical protein